MPTELVYVELNLCLPASGLLTLFLRLVYTVIFLNLAIMQTLPPKPAPCPSLSSTPCRTESTLLEM